jgi:sigma-B regulation protein RsbU (phosphoserine phosphatase)
MARVLIVDDDQMTVEMLGMAVGLFGHEPWQALSGQQALEIIAARCPDVVLLDLMMPGMDGHETLRRVRAMPGMAQLPVFVVTASADRDLEEGVIAIGATAFVRKPVDLDTLAKLIEQVSVAA